MHEKIIINGALIWKRLSSSIGLVKEHKKSDQYEPLFEQIKSVLNSKNDQYLVDPISVLTIDDLLCQIKIKAVRAQLTCDPIKLEDELQDIVVYGLLTLHKIKDRGIINEEL